MRFDRRANLSQLKADLQAHVDSEAGALRARFITVTTGQDMVYWAKQQEAQLIAADPQQGASVPDAETPHVSAEALADGVSRFEKAVEILTIYQLWATVSPLIEGRRLAAKQAISAATTPNAARTAAVIDWRDVDAYAQSQEQ
ncbi:hypothetical protein [Rhizobium sp. A37_96]